jgi:hypothetical protein
VLLLFSEGRDWNYKKRGIVQVNETTRRASSNSRVLYGLTAVIASLGAFLTLHLWQMHAAIPLYYSNGGDELIMLAWTKAIIEDGWYSNISHLGAPLGMSFGDFPVPNLLHMAILRVVTLLIPNAVIAVNLYYLAGFPLIAMISAYVLRRLGMTWPTSITISVVYAFLPMRFMRNEGHLFYAQYYLVPILILALIWIFRDHALFDYVRRRPTRDGYIFLVGLLAVSWDNEYNAVFGMSLLFVAGVSSVVRTRALRGAAAAAVGILVILVGVELELLPTTIYERQHGADAAAIVRPPNASEIYALTLAQLVLPIQNHRINKFAAKRAFFDAGLPLLINENSSASLGALGALGFIGSLGALLLYRAERNDELWPDLARINLAAFLLATVGGVGALISYYFVPELRAYNRISPLIGFVSLVIVAIAFDIGRRKWLARPSMDRAWYGGLALIAVLAILDQTSVAYIPAYAADQQAYSQDGAFAAAIEQRLPSNAEIYQIPHILFPEGPPVQQLGSWDQSALYLQSHTLRYSFGVTRGRETDAWQQQVDGLSPRPFLEELILAGFDGIVVYRSGYADHGTSEEAALTAQLGEAPMARDDGAMAFYDLSKLRASYVSGVGSATANRVRAAVLAPSVDVSLGVGFYGIESSGEDQWTWAGKAATLSVNNLANAAIPVTLNILAETARSGPATLRISGPQRSLKAAAIDGKGKRILLKFLAPRGASSVAFSTDAKPLVVLGDPRDLRFRLLDWTISDSVVFDAAGRVGRMLDHVSANGVAYLSAAFDEGCYGTEANAGNSWHWCGNVAEMTLENNSGHTRVAELEYSLKTAKPAPVSVRVAGKSRTFLSTPQGSAVQQSVLLPPGRTALRMSSIAQPVVAPGDPRRLVIQISNLRLEAPR